MNLNIHVRPATERDVPQILALVQELALYEKAPDEVENTVARMKEDGFGENRIFKAFVAEVDGTVVGTAITYFRYSTWKGKCLFLEDLVVTETMREKGVGKALFNQCMAFGKETHCKRMNWQVLDWNTPAIEFYKKYNADLDEEWINGTVVL